MQILQAGKPQRCASPKLSSPTDFSASKHEWDAQRRNTCLQKKGRMRQINFLPCYAPCAGRGALPTPRGAGRHTCARARGRAPLRAPLLARAGAGWAGRGGGTRRWRSSPSRPSSNHCSVLLSNDNMDNKHVLKAAASFFHKNGHQRWYFHDVCHIDQII